MIMVTVTDACHIGTENLQFTLNVSILQPEVYVYQIQALQWKAFSVRVELL